MDSKNITENLISFYKILPGIAIKNEKFAGFIRNFRYVENTLHLVLHICFTISIKEGNETTPTIPPSDVLIEFGISKEDLTLQM